MIIFVLYAPPDRTLGLWDTWLFQQGDDIHLFYLQRERSAVECSSIGHALTRDWVHWETLPPALRQGSGTDWDAGPLMTGMALAHEGRTYMFYGAMVDRVQRIGLVVSDDLITWEKASSDPVLEPGGAWYQTDPTETINYETAWRDPYVFYHAPESCFYAFICARVVGGGDVGGGCVAVARSETLLDWTLLPPAYVSDSLTCLEVPEYFSLHGRHYLTYTTSYHFGTPYPVHDPYQATGTFYLVSDDMLRSYHAPDHDNALNASLPNSVASYVGRSIPTAEPSRRIFYYQNVWPPQPGQSLYGSLSAPKLLSADSDGRLQLRYAPFALEPHTEKVVELAQPVGLAVLLAVAHDNAPDGIFDAVVTAPYAGICFRMGPGREGLYEGLAVWIAPDHSSPQRVGARQRVLLGTVHFSDGPWGQRPALGSPAALRDLDGTGMLFPASISLRVVCRGTFVDVYVNDELRLSHTYAPDAMPQGNGVGAFYAGRPKQDAVTHISVRRLTDAVMSSTPAADGR